MALVDHLLITRSVNYHVLILQTGMQLSSRFLNHDLLLHLGLDDIEIGQLLWQSGFEGKKWGTETVCPPCMVELGGFEPPSISLFRTVLHV